MEIVKVYVTDLSIKLIDVSQVGDPALGWTQVLGESHAAGIGFLDDKSRVQIDPIRLTDDEAAQLISLTEAIARRLESEKPDASP